MEFWQAAEEYATKYMPLYFTESTPLSTPYSSDYKDHFSITLQSGPNSNSMLSMTDSLTRSMSTMTDSITKSVSNSSKTDSLKMLYQKRRNSVVSLVQDKKEMALAIFNSHIAQEAPRQVNLDAQTRLNIELMILKDVDSKEYGVDWDATLFAQAQEEVGLVGRVL